jgi:elongation factor P--beta-lysine ligase
MSIKDELLTLQHEHGGILQAEAGVAWARDNPASELYHALEWDDIKAGHQHRLTQMRQLIRVHVRTEEDVRQLISLTIDRVQPGGGYRHIDDVLPVPELRAIMLADAFAELERIRVKYQHLVELANVWLELDRARDRERPPQPEMRDPQHPQ